MQLSFAVLLYAFLLVTYWNPPLQVDGCDVNDVRLVDGPSSTEGRVELCDSNGVWGTICQNYWDARDAMVVCRQLGYESTTAIGFPGYSPGGMGPIHRDYVACVGTESSLAECPPCAECSINTALCTHSHDVGVSCFPRGNECADGQLRLVGGSITVPEGKVEICVGGFWGSVCGARYNWTSGSSTHTFTATEAAVVCKQLGYPVEDARFSYFQGGINYSRPIMLYNLQCTGQESSILNCSHSGINVYENCWHFYDAGVVCEGCRINDVRLVDGPSSSEGRVELCNSNGVWGTICHNYWDARDAMVVCRQLEYESTTAIGFPGYSPGGTGLIHRDYVACVGTEPSLAECPPCAECTINTLWCSHSHDVGVNCFPQGADCADGNIRLTGGNNSESEGKIEICVRGFWGSVCGSRYDWMTQTAVMTFTDTDAAVVCRQLGYSMEGANFSYFANGIDYNIPIMLDNLQCSGQESSILDCPHSGINVYGNCWHQYDAGVACERCNEHDIRLNGGTSTEGRVEICQDGKWGTICWDLWDARDAQVVCRELGYENTSAIGILAYGGGSGAIHLDNVDCSGDEASLSECPVCIGCPLKPHPDCNHSHDVGVECFPQGMECSDDGDLRLAGGNTLNEGILEVCFKGFWGTVCGYRRNTSSGTYIPKLSDTAASVACRQIGYYSGSVMSLSASQQMNSRTTGPIFLDNVNCTGNESRLDECQHDGINVIGSCYRWTDVGITCHGCQVNEVRLVDGPQNGTEGRVEVCDSNEVWGTICHNYWDARDAMVVCRQLGYESTTAIGFPGYSPGGTGLIHRDYVACNGTESSLAECPPCAECIINTTLCTHSHDVGVSCFPQGTECTNGSIRLKGGSSASNGRIEVCVRGYWGSVCGFRYNWMAQRPVMTFTDADAAVVCRQVGYSVEGARFSYFGDGIDYNIPIMLDNLQCSGQESSILDCPHSGINVYGNCWHQYDAGVTCQGCRVNEVRLVEGRTSSEGRVELCDSSGVWGTICQNLWDARDAMVVCRQLGYESTTAIGFPGYSPGGTGPIHRDNVACVGTESSLVQCPEYDDIDTSVCTHNHDVGVSCFPRGLECGDDGDLRFAAGSSNEGILEVCFRKYWGTVCGYHYDAARDDFVSVFSDISASVACRQMGYDSGIALPFNDSQALNRPANTPIFLDNVNCIGTESRLADCQHDGVNIFGYCYTWTDVGVKCNNIITSTDTEASHSIRIAVGGSVGGAILITLSGIVCVSLLCLYYFRSTKKRSARNRPFMDGMELVITSTEREGAVNPYYKRGELMLNKEFNVSEEVTHKLLLSTKDLRLMDILGQGEFGVVYKAHLLKPLVAPRPETGVLTSKASSISLMDPTQPMTVAVKTLKGSFAESDTKELIQESIRMYEFDHPNVLGMLGICLDAGPAPYIVMPFMANGSLLSYVKKDRKNLLVDSEEDEESISIARKRLVDMCLQVARGMEYLAKKKIVHRDLAARNCMIDSSWVIKVADFGLSESVNASKDYFRQIQDETVKLPVKWMSPESLHEGIFSEKSDVWSFGVTCWEVFSTGRAPYPGVHPLDVIKQLDDGLRPDKPKNVACSNEMYNVMKMCWEQDPKARPGFSAIVQSINGELQCMTDYLDVSTFSVNPTTISAD